MALSLAAASAAGEEASWRSTSAHSPHMAEALSAATDPRGAFGYTEQHWLAALKQTGVAPANTRRIFLTSTGRAYVPVAAERRHILGLRQDIVIAGQVAFLEAKANAVTMRRVLRHWPSIAELHAAHIFGAAAATRLVLGAAANPGQPAAEHLGPITIEHAGLLSRGGRPMAASDLMHLLEQSAAAHGVAGSERDRNRPLPAGARLAATTAWTTSVHVGR